MTLSLSRKRVEVDAAQHPLVRHVGAARRALGGLGLDLVGHRAEARQHRRVGRDLFLDVAHDFDAVDPARLGVRHLHAVDRLPIAQHQVEVGIAGDVVVVLRADRRRQLGLAVEQDRVVVLPDLERDRGQRAAVKLLDAGRRHVGRMLQRIEHQGRRTAHDLAGLRREPDAGHRLAALFVGDVADALGEGLGVFHLLRRRIFLVAVPFDADRVVGEIAGRRIGGVAEEARLAARLERLAGLPELGLALDRNGLQLLERVGAALRGDRLLHEIGGRLRRCRTDQRTCQRCAEYERNSGHNDTQHENPPGWQTRWFAAPVVPGPSYYQPRRGQAIRLLSPNRRDPASAMRRRRPRRRRAARNSDTSTL